MTFLFCFFKRTFVVISILVNHNTNIFLSLQKCVPHVALRWRAVEGARFISMDGQTQRIQLVSADNSMALGHRIQVRPRHSSLINKANETGSSKTWYRPPSKWREWQCWHLRCRVHFLLVSRSDITRRASGSSPPQHQKEEVWWSLVWGFTLCERTLLTLRQESQTTLMSLHLFLVLL